MSGQKPGAKPLTTRDWVFGSRPRRLLLRGVLLHRAPREGWSKTGLATIAEVSRHGGVDEHVDGLARLGLLAPADRRWVQVRPPPPLARGLAGVLRELEHVSDEDAADAPAQSAVSVARDDRGAIVRELHRARRAVHQTASLDEDTKTRVVAVIESALDQLADDVA